MEHGRGQTIVDRGPGTASTIANATFGGAVSIPSAEPAHSFGVTPYGSFGSYNIYRSNMELDTGTIESRNGLSGFIDVEGLCGGGLKVSNWML